MEILLEFICAVMPAILLVAFILWRDKERPEPMRMIIKGFIYGCLSVVLTLIFDDILSLFYIKDFDNVPVIHAVYYSFYLAALPEETAKLIMLWLLLCKCKDFDESLDGIVYAVCVGMGFAMVENIGYVFNEESWGGTAFARAILAVPGHYIDAVLMGFFYALVHFVPKKFGKYRFMIWFAPFLAHGIYDSLCFLGQDLPGLESVAVIVLFYFCYQMHRFCLSRIKSARMNDDDVKMAKMFEAGMKNEEE